MASPKQQFLSSLKTLVGLQDSCPNLFSTDNLFSSIGEFGIDVVKFRKLANSLHKEARSSRKTTIKSKRKRVERAFDKARQAKSVNIQAAILEKIRQWVSGNNIPSLAEAQDPVVHSPSFLALYSSLRKDEDDKTLTKLKRRFKLLSIYRGVVDAGYYTGRAWARGGAKNKLLTLLHREGLANEEDLTAQNLERFVQLGQGFNIWSEAFGGDGYLLLLPTEISETT